MKIKVPSRKIRERFLLIYELKGCQKAVDFLTKYYGARRMKIVLDGRRVGKSCIATYFDNKACFTRRGLTKKAVLHELYHHLVEDRDLDMPTRTEEKDANSYARWLLSGH